MAHFIDPGSIRENIYQGLTRIFQYTNGDGEHWQYNCGQAAACTFLTFHGCLPPAEDKAQGLMRQIEDGHPPDNMGGFFGTSRRRVERICRANGVRTRAIRGETQLRKELTENRPVIVMLGVPGPKVFKRYTMPAGHWMVAYGFDDERVFLTNHGTMSWEEFRKGWRALVPRLISMNHRGLVSLRDDEA